MSLLVENYLSIVRPPNYVTTATPTHWGKPLWFVNKHNFDVILHFFEIFNQFCIDKKLLPKKCIKSRYYLHSLYCNYDETCINHYVTLLKRLKRRLFSVRGTWIWKHPSDILNKVNANSVTRQISLQWCHWLIKYSFLTVIRYSFAGIFYDVVSV